MGQNRKKGGKNKAKGKKNEAGTSRTADDDNFDDLNDGFDDDGTIYPEDIECLCKLVFSETHNLRQLGSDLLEKFKNRSMLSIGTSLCVMYDYLYTFDQSRNNCGNLRKRLIIQYLVYRCREIEPMLKRKGQDKRKDSILGHPFADFILRFLHRDSIPSVFHEYEYSIASLILCRRGVELDSIDVRTLPDVAGSLTPPRTSEVDANYQEINLVRNQMIDGWPQSFEQACVVPLNFCDSLKTKKKVVDVSDFIKHLTSALCDEEPYYVLDGLEIPIDTVYRLDEHPLARFTIPHIADGKVEKDDAEDAYEESRLKLKQLMSEIVAKIESGEELKNEDTILAHSFMALMEPDDPIVQKLRNSNVRKLAFDGFSSLLSTNYKNASDMLYNMILENNSVIRGILVMFSMMDVTVQVLEIVRRLYENIPDLPREPIHDYAMYCVDYCQKGSLAVSNQKTRCVRLVCMFITSLLKQKILEVKDISMSSLQTFCLNFNQLKEATTLYQLLVELNRKSCKQ